jgi:cytochrome c oxidase subunit 2
MREWVYAEPPDQFNAWAQQQAQPVTSGAARGEQVFVQRSCVSCHAIRGLPGAVAQVGPDLTHLASRRTIGAGVVDNTPQTLRAWILNAGAIKPGVRMPPFQGLPADETNALVDYLESLK